MAKGVSCWNQEHDICVITWDHRPNDLPLDPINSNLEKFYAQGLHPYLFEVYRFDVSIGLILSENFNPENDLEIDAVFNQVTGAPDLGGEFAPQEWSV